MRLDYDSGLNLYLLYPEMPESSEVNQLQGARWNKIMSCWLLPPINASLYGLKRLYGEIDLTEEAKFNFNRNNYVSKAYVPELDEVLFEFQKEAINFLVNSIHHGLLLSLSPGLGKTPVSIVAANILGFKKILVICPLILTRTWADEIKKWANQESRISHGPATLGSETWLITNYDSVVNHISTYMNMDWDLVICDESILLKSRGDIKNEKVVGTKRVATLKRLTKKVPKVWLLSGSPVSKYADDLYAQFNIMLPGYFQSYWKFVYEYCYTQKSPWGTQIRGTRRTINFVEEFKDIMFRRNQESVLSELPDMLFETYFVDLNDEQNKVYKELENEFIATLDNEEISVTTKLSLLIRLQQITSNLSNLGDTWPDTSSKLDLLTDLIENGEIENPCVIWVNWVKSGQAIVNKINMLKPGKVGYIHGEISQLARETILNNFKDNHLDYLVMTLGTGKYGLNLQNAREMIYYDKSYDSDAYLQSLDRVHRIGLKHIPIVISLVAKKTVDELIYKNLLNKAISMSKINGSEMKMLFESLKNE